MPYFPPTYAERELKIIDTDDTMTVRSFFDERSVRFQSIERIAFADGTVWDVNEINERQNQPTRGADYLVGGEGDDTIDALEGDDIVLGLGGNDTLNGGDDSDRVYGGDGSGPGRWHGFLNHTLGVSQAA